MCMMLDNRNSSFNGTGDFPGYGKRYSCYAKGNIYGSGPMSRSRIDSCA